MIVKKVNILFKIFTFLSAILLYFSFLFWNDSTEIIVNVWQDHKHKHQITLLIPKSLCEWLKEQCTYGTWWRHQMATFSALLAICAGNSPVPGEFPAQRPVMRSFDVFFDLRLNKRLSKQSWGWWFETLLRPLWRHRNEFPIPLIWIFLFCIIICDDTMI